MGWAFWKLWVFTSTDKQITWGGGNHYKKKSFYANLLGWGWGWGGLGGLGGGLGGELGRG